MKLNTLVESVDPNLLTREDIKEIGMEQLQPYPQSSDAYPPSSQAYPPPPQVVLQHPFTLMAIGPTFSGKSCWMNRLLIHAKTMINPPPERIIWSYKGWQPLFSEMQSTIKNILFLQGLQENLNDDSFIETRYPF